uniref:Uncharacterized protein n=1 Tax=Nelumbo nucifera TaxID=4432 RepID=A0A822YKG1_NELNU|nr:TPA_asm: hypothetical protein HUJ06_010892 [Nelumbo nucifera]
MSFLKDKLSCSRIKRVNLTLCDHLYLSLKDVKKKGEGESDTLYPFSLN